MSLAAKSRRAPVRAVTGAFIVSSGVGKLSATDETAKAVHGFATGTYPFLAKLKPQDFVKLLAGTEIALGSALLLPFVEVLLGAYLILGLFTRGAAWFAAFQLALFSAAIATMALFAAPRPRLPSSGPPT